MLRELQHTTAKQFNKIRKTIQKKWVQQRERKHNKESYINFGVEEYKY